MINDEFIIKYFKFNKCIKYSKLKKCDENIILYLQNRYEYIDKIEESIYRIIYHLEIRPTCPICGNKLIFNNRNHFTNTCSKNCTNKLRLNHIKNTLLNTYGVDNCQKIKDIKEKSKQTCLKKYGTDNPSKSEIIKEKTKQTCLKKYDKEYYTQTNEQKEKSKQTCLKKYGVEYSFQSDNNKEKSKQTCLKKYGKEYYTQTDEHKEKSKQTCLKKYGVEYSFQSDNNKEKSKQTCLKKYGEENYRNPQKHKQTMLEKYGTTNTELNKIKAHSIESNLKRYLTKKKNNTFNTSQPEEESYILLKEKYPDVKRQYRSKIYPFNCDFYIPSLDLYIEYNEFWTHGKHPYNSNNIEDQNKLKEWINKDTNFYKNAIYTWTILDIRKRNIAKENKLNYIEFWNINELKIWLNN